MMKLDDFLQLADEELGSIEDYPDHWQSGEVRFPLKYEFLLGSDSDGVTLQTRDENLSFLHPYALEWLVQTTIVEHYQRLGLLLQLPTEQVVVILHFMIAQIEPFL